ncbi:MAG: amidohydrolase [Candidatus Onthomonas sp.]
MAQETLFYGGTILPMTGEQDRAGALLVREGHIAFVGDLNGAKALSGPDTEQVNLKGKTLLPAFIDAHSHLPMAAQFSCFADLGECTNLEQIAAVLTAYQREHAIGPEGAVLGVNYDNNFLDGSVHPDRTLLDQVSTDTPVFALHVSGHMGVANSRLLELCGYTDDSPDPQGGRLGRDAAGHLTGYLEEISAMTPALMAAFGRVKMDMPAQMAAAQQQYLSYGVTTVQDGAGSPQSLQMLSAFAAAGLLQLDVVSYLMADQEAEQTITAYPAHDGRYSGHYKIGGYKVVLDGSPQGRTAWLSRPYEGSDFCAYPYMQDEALYDICKQAVANHRQLLAHCNGDAASEQFLNQYTRAWSESPDRPMLRPTMIHCQTVRDDQLDRMPALGMIPSIFVAHTYFWGDVHLNNLGPQRGARISPARSALERGLVYNFHQDTPVTKPDMLLTVWCAVNRRTRTGGSIGPEQAVSVYDALKGVTVNAAYAYGEEDKKGTLEAGKLADLVVLEADPLSVEPMAIKDIAVAATYKEGECLYGGL